MKGTRPMPKWFTARWFTGAVALMMFYSSGELTRYIISYVLLFGFEWKFVAEIIAIWTTFIFGLFSVYRLIKGKDTRT